MIDLQEKNEQFETASPREILIWARDTFMPDIALSSSFGTESVVLLHLLSLAAPEMRVFFLETGFHFPETEAYKEELKERFHLKVVELKAKPGRREELLRTYSDRPYDVNPDFCCQVNKVEPFQEALKGLRAWISGIRRAQGETRKDIHIVELYEGGLYKINPLTNCSSEEIWDTIRAHDLPLHPLFEKGYKSIGCWPCTAPVLPGEEDRAGRWRGRVKTECGLHTFMKQKNAEGRV